MRRAGGAAAAVAAGCLVGCFVDIDNYVVGGASTGGSTTTDAPTIGGATTDVPGGTATAPTTGEPTSAGPFESTSSTTTAATTTTAGDGTTTGDATQAATGAPMTTEPPPPSCPALDAFVSPHTQDAACDACLRERCCGAFEGCGGACVGVWNCAHNETCLADWGSCPDFAANKPAFDATTACMSDKCQAVCNHGPCAAQNAACFDDPACAAIGDCSDVCIAGCAADDAGCPLACWGACKQMHPGGAPEWDAFWACVGDACA